MPDSDAPTGQAVAAGPSQAIDFDARCHHCGYNLRGLPHAGTCPECNTSCAESTQQNRRLADAPLAYLRRLDLGFNLILLCQIVWIFTAGAGLSLTIGDGPPYQRALGLLFASISTPISAVGWWLVTATCPGLVLTASERRTRRLIRLLILLGGGGQLVLLAINAAHEFAEISIELAPVASLGCLMILAIHFVTSVLFLQSLAQRLRDDVADDNAARLLWLGPLLCTCLGLVLGLGLLVTYVLYFDLLTRVSTGVREIVQAAKRKPAETSPPSGHCASPHSGDGE